MAKRKPPKQTPSAGIAAVPLCSATDIERLTKITDDELDALRDSGTFSAGALLALTREVATRDRAYFATSKAKNATASAATAARLVEIANEAEQAIKSGFYDYAMGRFYLLGTLAAPLDGRQEKGRLARDKKATKTDARHKKYQAAVRDRMASGENVTTARDRAGKALGVSFDSMKRATKGAKK